MHRKDSKGKNGYEIITDTYDIHRSPIIENRMTATVFPWNMKKDVDYIDSMRFSNKK